MIHSGKEEKCEVVFHACSLESDLIATSDRKFVQSVARETRPDNSSKRLGQGIKRIGGSRKSKESPIRRPDGSLACTTQEKLRAMEEYREQLFPARKSP